MHIIKFLSRHRRDFSAQLKCESCGAEDKLTTGYDDEYYHNEVLPNRRCPQCQESTNSIGDNGIRTRPSQPDSTVM